MSTISDWRQDQLREQPQDAPQTPTVRGQPEQPQSENEDSRLQAQEPHTIDEIITLRAKLMQSVVNAAAKLEVKEVFTCASLSSAH